MPLTIAELSPVAIHFDPTDEVLEHTATELRAHLASPRSPRTRTVHLVHDGQDSDGFEVLLTNEAVTIRGESARGTLNGAYFLLERLGFLWVRPGASGTRFVDGLSIEEGTYRSAPSFPRRTLILGNDALHDDWEDWLAFASRNRLNSVFFHDTPPSVIDRAGAQRPATAEELTADGKGWMFELWDRQGARVLTEVKCRGMTLQFGGHHLPGLLPRALFDEHPDWFPVRDGKRDPRYNLCTSSPGAIGEVRARARAFFQRFAGADVYHLWADDIVGGGWCACADCAELSPSDQALRATNVLAEELAAVSPGSVVAHLAYHDTIAPPKVFVPGANVSALYAPRNRNYAFAIDDPACPRNVDDHFTELVGLGRTFASRPESLAVFEYYSDAVLYKWMDPPNLRVLPGDAVAYQNAGVFDFGDLAVTPRPWVGPTWHAWWFARCAWDSGASPQQELEAFCRAAFAENAHSLTQTFLALDSAYRKLLDLGELERIPRHDVLDFSDSPRDALAEKAAQLREAAADLNAAMASVPLRPAALTLEFREDLAVQLAMVNHLAERITAWDAALAGRNADAELHLNLARTHLNAVKDWDLVHSTTAYANLSSGMFRAAIWHTERIARLIAE